jgi:transcription initiation factor TFIIIB Brf1 subunit/transcription initiation factor TFIIB
MHMTGHGTVSHKFSNLVDKKCPNCGNNEQTDFIMDAKNGDIICQNCGAVVIESLMHEGSQFRKFEGEIC